MDLVMRVLMLMLPSIFVAPMLSWGGRPPEYVVWIARALRVSRAWYASIVGTGPLWAALMAVAVTRVDWFFFLSLSQSAPKYLLYRGNIDWFGRLDGQLEQAAAVYSESDCEWRHWGQVMQGLNMQFVKVLILRPRENRKPAGVLPSPTLPVWAPFLIYLVLSSPAVFIASRLTTLIITNFSEAQLRNAFRALTSVMHLDVQRTTTEIIDWTAVLAEGHWDFLEVLVIRGNEQGTDSLALHTAAVETPRLREIEASGALLARSQSAETMQLEYAAHTDLLRMLGQAPSLLSLTVEVLREGEWPHTGWVDWDGTERIQLSRLESLHIENDLSDSTVDVLDSIWAPELFDLALKFDVSGPANRAALDDVVVLLDTAMEMGGVALEAVFRQAKEAFRRSGHTQLMLASELPGGVPNAPNLADAATLLRQRVSELAADPLERRAEDLLRDVIEAACVSWDLTGGATSGECVLVVEVTPQAMRWYAAIEDRMGGFRYIHLDVVGTPLRANWGISDWDRIDSMAYGGARVLRGLRDLPTVELVVRHADDDPFELANESCDDMRELSAALATYVELDTLRFDLGPQANGSGLLKAIPATGLDCLTHIYVRSHGTSGGWMSTAYPTHRRWFDELERTLRRRAEQGRQLQYLDIQGYFCLCGLWLKRVRQMVDTVVVDVSCTRRVRYICLACDPRGPIYG